MSLLTVEQGGGFQAEHTGLAEETDYSSREAEATESSVSEFWKGGRDKELPRNLRVPLNLC